MHYRFRAECSIDVVRLLRLIYASVPLTITITPVHGFPDVDVDLTIDMPIEDLRHAMRYVTDGHVMVETVQNAENYSGERTYSQDDGYISRPNTLTAAEVFGTEVDALNDAKARAEQQMVALSRIPPP